METWIVSGDSALMENPEAKHRYNSTATWICVGPYTSLSRAREANDRLHNQADRIAELEEANIDLMVASAKHYRCVGQRDARIAELEAQLAEANQREQLLRDYYDCKMHDRERPSRLEAQLAEAKKDSARLDWFQNEAFGAAIISDDDGYFAVSGSGCQNCRVDNKGPLETTFFVEEDEFFDNVRAAIDAAREPKP